MDEKLSDRLRSFFVTAWAINDRLRIEPDQSVTFTGSTNDVDLYREQLHDLDPLFRGEPADALDAALKIAAAKRS